MAAIPFAILIDCVGTTAKVGVVSLYSDDVTITVNGTSSGAITTTAVSGQSRALLDSAAGDSSGGGTIPACYNASHTFSSLPANSLCSVSVTQGSNTQTGSFRTDPGTADFSAFFITCDSAGTTTIQDPVGCYAYIKDYIQNGALPTAAVIHTDDHGYSNKTYIKSTDADVSPTNLVCNKPDTDKTVYAHALTHCAYLGLLETDEAYDPDGTNDAPYTNFHDESRIWVRHNCVYKRSVGDHEFTNNPEEVEILVPTWRPAAQEAWVNTLGLVTTYLDTGASLAWVNTLGPMQLIAYDRWRKNDLALKNFDISGVSGTAQEPLQGGWDGGSRILGNAQVIDIQAAVAADTTSPYRVVCMSTGSTFMRSKAQRIASIVAGDNQAVAGGAQEPIGGYTNSNTEGYGGNNEWDVLMRIKPDATFTDGGIAYTANQYGHITFGLHGDTHGQYEYHHYAPEDATYDKYDFLECSCGTVVKQTTHAVQDQMAGWYKGFGGYDYKTGHVQWFPTYRLNGEKKSTCIRLDVLQSQNKILINYLDVSGTTATTLRQTTIKYPSSTTGAANYRKGYL